MYDKGTVLRIETVINNQGGVQGCAGAYAAKALM
jgi:hypothetical protein